jgi:DNA repair exonuclease SbcCD ATPase subunit
MLKFLKIKYKNFLSSGNYWTEINFIKNTSTLIIGKNGAGKSTFLDALTFVLFNKPFRRINKNQLANSVNEKDCVVEIEFEIGPNKWKVIRGIKPTIFEIYQNGDLLNQSSSANDQQKWLEQTVLKLNYKSFTQIVVLGSSNFIPFMQLSSQHRREVVEDLLSIKVFSSMNDIAKVNIKSLRDEVKELQYKKENAQDKINTQNNFILELEKRNAEDIEEKNKKLDDLIDKKKSITDLNESLLTYIKDKTKDLDQVSSSKTKLKKLDTIKVKLLQKVSMISEEQDFFNGNVVCPTCTQDLDERFRLNKIADIEDKKTELKSACEELEKTIQDEKQNETKFLEISEEITKLNNEINTNNVKVSEFERQYRDLQQEVQKLVSRNTKIDSEYEKLNNFKASFDEVVVDISSKKEELLNYEFIHLLLKDDGAKSKIIKKYLPLINKNLNKYLEIFEFPINFTLDQEFNEKALNPIYEDFSYASFSEGEKMRIDLSLLFTWREIAKVKNSINTNLLILDEVFDSSLDDYGTDNFTKIIKYIINKSNVFLISHKTDELVDKFDSIIKFEKVKGFSMMVDSD